METSLLRVPFFLEPDYPADEKWRISNLERLRQKWGGAREFEAQKRRHQLKERGLAVGISHYVLDRPASNTMRSHRLVQFVSKSYSLAKAEALYTELNRRHFAEGQALNDAAMLADAALVSAGVPRKETVAFLADPLEPGKKEIQAAYAMCHEIGINGIPTFLVNGQHLVNGAAGADEFCDVLTQIDDSGEPQRDPAFAPLLGVLPEVYNGPGALFVPTRHFASARAA
mmetsp:Transcript_3997/g.12337  ORF Transcript_3997/g.12337 Transcript_3997/m.12337 type:complete len:228 (+) Transcript_3997:185-868(+)